MLAQSSKAILDYAFNNYSLCSLLEDSKSLGTLPVLKGKQQMVHIIPENGIEMPLTNEEKENMEVDFCLYSDKLTAPVEADLEVGYIKFNVKDNQIAKVILKTSNYIERKHFSDYYKDILNIWYKLIKQNTPNPTT